MKLPRFIPTIPLVVIVIVAGAQAASTHAVSAQAPARIAIRAVTPPSASSPTIGSVDKLLEIGGGKVLVNDGKNRALVVFDGTLQHPTVLADTLGSVTAYPRFGKLIPHTLDSSLFYEADSRSLIVISPEGQFGQVLSLPRPQDFNLISNTGFVSSDNHGHLVYQGRRSLGFGFACNPPTNRPTASDSVDILRADFEKRTVDTVGRSKTIVPGASFPTVTYDVNCKVISAKVRVNPSIQPTDSWTVTSRGAVAIVRSHDYHIDWINPDGTKRSTPKMPFDWKRLTDAEKQGKVDSARKIIDSVTALGGYRMTACGGSMNFQTSVPVAAADERVVAGGGRGGGGTGGATGASGSGNAAGAPARNDCQTVVVSAEFVPLDSMADYIAPIREDAARSDLDGNVWILPTTSASAVGGLLYDVVNTEGTIVERVQLPGGRTIAGFGKSGVLYLSRGDYKNGYVIEKVKVVR